MCMLSFNFRLCALLLLCVKIIYFTKQLLKPPHCSCRDSYPSRHTDARECNSEKCLGSMDWDKDKPNYFAILEFSSLKVPAKLNCKEPRHKGAHYKESHEAKPTVTHLS